MKFACVTGMAPGSDLAQQCDAIAQSGCEGVETIVFADTPLARWQVELRTAAMNVGLQPVAVILGGLALYEEGQMPWIREALAAIAEVGAAALITPEYRAQDPLPLFPPYPAPPLEERGRVERALAEIYEESSRFDLPLLFEPVTPFESRFWRCVEDVLPVCQDLGDPRVALCLDFHNMNMTEAEITASIHQAGSYVRHIHLADNNRRLPGHGHIDFAAGLAALQQIDYRGWYTFECAAGEPFARSIRDTITMLRNTSLLL
jgi:sugar phosphate isomerase/epimerase